MKRGKLLGALLLFLLPMLAWAGLASAQTFRSGEAATVPSGERVNSTLYAFGRVVDVAGEVNGDVICGGQNVSISGHVRGDVICAGQTVRVDGVVDGDVRLAGQTVSIGSEVKGNASVAGENFTLEGDAKIGGDVGLGANVALLNGPIGRDLAAGSGSVTIANSVGRNVSANVEHLTLSENAKVGGKLEYTSANDAVIARGAEVAGATTRHQPPQESKTNYGAVFSFGWSMAVYAFLSLLLLSLALVLLFPGVFHQASGLALKDPLKTFLIGLAATILAPVLIVALMLTVIGIPLALLLGLIWLLVLALSGPMFSYSLGRVILRNHRSPILTMALGASVVLIAYMVPFLGVLVFCAVLWFGTGMFLREAMRRTPPPKYDLSKHGK